MTTIKLTDPALVEKLLRAESVELCDENGRILGRFMSSARHVAETAELLLRDDGPAEDERGGLTTAELFRALAVGQELRLPPGARSPISAEDRRENRKQLDGRPLKDILRDLEKLA